MTWLTSPLMPKRSWNLSDSDTRKSCRAFANEIIIPFIRANWQREWVAAFERTAEYVQNYVQGGRTLIKHQAVALRLAVMATKLNAVRALLREAARAVDGGDADADQLCNMVKVFASEEIVEVCKHAMELHGGNGVMLDFGIEKLFRDAAVFLHMDGTTDISRFKIVKAMFPHSAGAYAGPEK